MTVLFSTIYSVRNFHAYFSSFFHPQLINLIKVGSKWKSGKYSHFWFGNCGCHGVKRRNHSIKNISFCRGLPSEIHRASQESVHYIMPNLLCYDSHIFGIWCIQKYFLDTQPSPELLAPVRALVPKWLLLLSVDAVAATGVSSEEGPS